MVITKRQGGGKRGDGRAYFWSIDDDDMITVALSGDGGRAETVQVGQFNTDSLIQTLAGSIANTLSDKA